MNKIVLFSNDIGFLNNININNLNFIYISNILFYDSLINLKILNFCKKNSIKILIGKRLNQKSLFKKTFYRLIYVYYKKYKYLCRIKSGDLNLFSRINNEINFYNLYRINVFFLYNNKNYLYNSLKVNITSILIINYFNNNFNLNFSEYFLNKTVIYYMINNNIFFIINNLKSECISFFIIIESYNFYFEKNYLFNFFDLNYIFIENFLYFSNPKILIYINYFSLFFFNNFFLNFIIFFK